MLQMQLIGAIEQASESLLLRATHRGRSTMSHSQLDLSIDRILDDAIAHPDRLNELKRALRSRRSVLDLPAAPQRRTEPPTPATADPNDDSLWDNMPV